MSLAVVSVLDSIALLGESETREVLSEFSCRKNPGIEHFYEKFLNPASVA